MDLKSGCMFWPGIDGPQPAYAPLHRSIRTDVAIIGGGITGALAAYNLTRAGVEAVLVDRREICRGSTVASSGLLQYEIDAPLVELIERLGPEHAKRAYRASVRALDDFQQLVSELDNPCGLVPRKSLYLASRAQDVPRLRQEFDARRRIGIELEFLTVDDLRSRFGPGFTKPAALLSASAMEVDPFLLAHTLIRCSTKRGLCVFAHTEVARYDADDSGVTLHTTAGHSIRAVKVLFATGYETPEFLRRVNVTLKTTYATTTHPLNKGDTPPYLPSNAGQRETNGELPSTLIWESARPYFYARPAPGGRAMLGGEDENFVDPARRDPLIPEKARTLAKKFNALYPGAGAEPDCAWCGTFAETPDGLPYIGTHPEFPRGYFALGYGGNGITFSLIAAQLLTARHLNQPRPDADLFRFDR